MQIRLVLHVIPLQFSCSWKLCKWEKKVPRMWGVTTALQFTITGIGPRL